MPHFKDDVYVNGVKIATTALGGFDPQAALTHLTDSTGGATGNNTLAAITANNALTDSSTGSASTTLAALSDLSTSNTYTDAALNAKILVIKNAIATFAAELALIRTAIGVIKDDFADLAAKQNEALTALETAGVFTV